MFTEFKLVESKTKTQITSNRNNVKSNSTSLPTAGQRCLYHSWATFLHLSSIVLSRKFKDTFYKVNFPNNNRQRRRTTDLQQQRKRHHRDPRLLKGGKSKAPVHVTVLNHYSAPTNST